MANIFDPTPDELVEWEKWLAERPDLKQVEARYPPWKLYRMKSTGKRVVVSSFGTMEDGSVGFSVIVSAQFNRVSFEREVVGVLPDDLEECDLPTDDEPVGLV